MDTNHWTALGLSPLQAVGTVGMWKDLPALRPALVVQVQVGGDFTRYCNTERGTAGGANRALKDPLGNAWKCFPTSDSQIAHGDDWEQMCFGGGVGFPMGDGGGWGSRAIPLFSLMPCNLCDPFPTFCHLESDT